MIPRNIMGIHLHQCILVPFAEFYVILMNHPECSIRSWWILFNKMHN